MRLFGLAGWTVAGCRVAPCVATAAAHRGFSHRMCQAAWHRMLQGWSLCSKLGSEAATYAQRGLATACERADLETHRPVPQDPQDAGPGYRNVIGIPGGINSPLFRVLQVSFCLRPLALIEAPPEKCSSIIKLNY